MDHRPEQQLHRPHLSNGFATAILEIAGTNALGPISSFNAVYVTLNGGTLATSNNITFNDGLRGFTVNGGTGGFDEAGGATLVIANPITGGGTLTKGTAGTVDDSGTLVLSGSNSFNGTLYVDSGNNVVNDGTFEVAGSYAIANVLSPIAIRNTLGGASTFALDGSSGNIVVTQDITLTGRSPNIPAIRNVAGTNTLAGNLTNGGAGGRYIIESDSGLLTMGSPRTYLSFSTTDPQTLTFQGNGSFFVLGTISDGTNATTTFTSITKAGSGSMTLQALNTYSGSTTVTGGALIVNGAIASGTNAQLVTISGGSLGGTGVINAPVTVGAAGTFAPGAPLGTLTINSNLTLAGNTLVSVSAPSTCSQVAGLTALTYGGTLTVTNVGGALAAGNSFQIFPATIGTGNFTSVSGSAGGGLGFTFNPTTGVLSVVSVIPSTPTNITYSVSSGSITLNWPSSYTGSVPPGADQLRRHRHRLVRCGRHRQHRFLDHAHRPEQSDRVLAIAAPVSNGGEPEAVSGRGTFTLSGNSPARRQLLVFCKVRPKCSQPVASGNLVIDRHSNQKLSL